MSEQKDGGPVEIVPEAVSTAAVTVTVGERLRTAREARGLSLDDVAQTLKLGTRQIDALERSQWAALPGVPLIRGFVRNYARLLAIDPAPLMAEFDALFAQPVDNLTVPENQPTPMLPSGRRIARRDRLVILAGLGLVLLATLAYYLMPGDLAALRENTRSLLDGRAGQGAAKPAETPPAPTASEPVFPPGSTPQQVMTPPTPSEPPAEPAPAATPAPATPAAPTSAPEARAAAPAAESKPEPGAPHIRFIADKESWVEIRDRDNKTIFSQRVPAGGEQSLSGRGPLSLVIGYAPGVRLFWHGQPVDLVSHARGDVARLVLE